MKVCVGVNVNVGVKEKVAVGLLVDVAVNVNVGATLLVQVGEPVNVGVQVEVLVTEGVRVKVDEVPGPWVRVLVPVTGIKVFVADWVNVAVLVAVSVFVLVVVVEGLTVNVLVGKFRFPVSVGVGRLLTTSSFVSGRFVASGTGCWSCSSTKEIRSSRETSFSELTFASLRTSFTMANSTPGKANCSTPSR